MNKKTLVEKLEEISVDMENFLGDSALLTAVKDFRTIEGKVDELLSSIDDEGITGDET